MQYTVTLYGFDYIVTRNEDGSFSLPPELKRWEGFDVALKPSHEPICIARKPLSGTVAANVCEYSTGALNIDGCRVWTEDDLNGGSYGNTTRTEDRFFAGKKPGGGGEFVQPAGRFPPNLLLSHDARCVRVGETSDPVPRYDEERNEIVFDQMPIPTYQCHPSCPVRRLDEQSGDRPGMSGGGLHRDDYGGGMFGAIDCEHTARGDTGGCSRFFPTFEWDEADWFPLLYVPKPSRAERDAGCEDLPAATAGEITGGRKEGSAGLDNPRAGAGRTSGGRNTHATVKPIQLMRHLCRLVTPPGGLCLDPFAGSGTTILAANLEGFRAIGFDLEEHHCEIARARIFHHVGGHYAKPERKPEPEAEPVRKQLALFGGGK